MLAWRAYYDDGSTFSSEDGEPSEAPPWGLLVVVQRDPEVGRFLTWHPEKGYFVWADAHGEWDVKDFTGLLDFLANFPGCVVRFGRGVPNRHFREIFARAAADPDFPKKSGLRAGEYDVQI